MMEILHPEDWQTKQKILVILAHPDDPEFFCGATLTRWIDAGHEVSYLLLTKGEKGSEDPAMTPEILTAVRMKEQRAAGEVIGVKEITFLDCPDGYLIPDLSLRKEVVRHIRQVRPDVIVTSDPQNYYIRGRHINHPDHRAAGLVTIEAVFPAAGNRFYYPELLKEGLEPHTPQEVWVSLPVDPTIVVDVTTQWSNKLKALLEHKSQIGDPEKFLRNMTERRTPDSSVDHPRYEESFRRLYRR
ncbi:MAG: PIG-L family deacetylase [Anaerolinea sp.]|nr:PIG-L family deacetylase [Anaerolinea sp.]